MGVLASATSGCASGEMACNLCALLWARRGCLVGVLFGPTMGRAVSMCGVAKLMTIIGWLFENHHQNWPLDKWWVCCRFPLWPGEVACGPDIRVCRGLPHGLGEVACCLHVHYCGRVVGVCCGCAMGGCCGGWSGPTPGRVRVVRVTHMSCDNVAGVPWLFCGCPP